MRPALLPTRRGPCHGGVRRRLAQTSALAGLLATAPVLGQDVELPVPSGALQPGQGFPVIGGAVLDGIPRIDTTSVPNTMTITPTAQRTVINWESFNIGADATVAFRNQAPIVAVPPVVAVPPPPLAVLNRVVGVPDEGGVRTIGRSDIRGSLVSDPNISVYLINQAGILFGEKANVSVGSLIGSTRDLSDNDFYDGTLKFVNVAPARLAPIVDGDGSIVMAVPGATAPLIRANAGNVVLIAAKIETRGTIGARFDEALPVVPGGEPLAIGGEVSVIAADDVTLTLNGEGPMSIAIAKGSDLGTPVLMEGTVAGRSILVAAATPQGITDALLDVRGTLEATTARPGDRGIVLVAGRTAAPASGVTLPAANAAVDRPVVLGLGATLTATGPGGSIDIRAANGITAAAPLAPATVGVRGTLDAEGQVLVRADAGGAVLGNVTSRLVDTVPGIDIATGAGGAIDIEAVRAQTIDGTDGSAARIAAGTGAVTIASLISNRDVAISGGSVTVPGAAISEAGTLNVTTTGGAIRAGTLTAAGRLTANAGAGDLIATTVTSANDVDLRAANVGGPAAAGMTLLSGGGVNVVATADATFARVQSVGQTSLRAGGVLTVTGSATTANGAIIARGASVDIAAVDSGDSVDLASTATTLRVGTVQARGNATVDGRTDATVTSLGARGNATLTAGAIARVTGGGTVGGELSVTGGDVRLGGVAGATQSVGGTARYTARSGTIADAGSATALTIRADTNTDAAAGAILLDADDGIDLRGTALLTGTALDATTIGNVGVRITAASGPLALGRVEAAALVQTGAALTGPVTLGATRLRNALTISTPGAIDVASVSITAPAQSLSLTSTAATVNARGTLDATGSVAVRARNAVTLRGVDARGGTMSLTSDTAGISTADDPATAINNPVSATGDVTVSAPGTILLGDVTSTAGTIAFLPANATATLTAGAVNASGTLTVTRDAAIQFGTTTSRNGDVAITGTAVTLGGLSADRGAATLVATAPTGGITVTGGALANGDLIFDARGAITLGDVTSRTGTVLFRAGGTPAGGAITAGAVAAEGDLIVDRPAALTFGSATSRTGAVRLTAAGSRVTVQDDTQARTDVVVRAGTIGLNTLRATAGTTATNGVVDIAANAGSLTAGALTAGGAIIVAASGSTTADASFGVATAGSLVSANATRDLRLDGVVANRATLFAGRDITATGGLVTSNFVTVDAGASVRLASVTDTGAAPSRIIARGGTIDITGATSLGGSLDVRATGNVTLARVESTGGAVDLTSGGTIVARAVLANRALIVTGTGAASQVTLASATAGGTIDVTAAGGVTIDTTAPAGGAVTSTGSTVRLTSAGIVRAGAVRANGLVDVSAGGDATLGSVVSDGGAVRLASGGALNAAAVQAETTLAANGQTGVTLASVRSVDATVTLGVAAGGVTVNGTTQASGNVGIAARDAITLGDVVSGATATIASTLGGVAALSVDAARIDVGGRGAVTIDSIVARGTGANGSARLVSGAGVTLDTVTTGTTFAADAGATLRIGAATVGGAATLLGGDVAVTTIGAGTLAATARSGDLTLETATIRGAATLTKRGATGAISLASLDAAGAIRIDSAGAVRADRITGGDTTIVATGGAVSGRSDGLSAQVRSLDVAASGGATIASVTTTGGGATIRATGATALAGALDIAGGLVASGATVTLGGTVPLTQSASGSIDVASATGAITGLGGLTLRSGSGDTILRSATEIAFAPSTVLAGGSARGSAVRLVAGRDAAIALGTVDARTIASATGAALVHDGPVSIVAATTRDTLDVRLAGRVSPTLTIGTAEVVAGDLRLDAGGAVTTGALTARAGRTVLAGASIDSGAILTRDLSATTRSGAATFSTIDATAGGIAVTAATDLRLTRGTATGAGATPGTIALSSATGDITGNAVPGGFAGAVLATNGTVDVRADDATRGLVSLDTVAGAGGVTLFGRGITAETIASSNGGVTATTRRDAAGLTDRGMAIGTIDAARTIALTTGNRVTGGGVTLALDRATSQAGDIRIAVTDGTLGARTGSAPTILSAPLGEVAVDVGGAAVLGSAIGATTTIAATSLDITEATATGGTLALTARDGALTIGTGRAATTATLVASGALVADSLAAGTTLSADADTAAIRALTTGGDARVTGTTSVAIDSATVPGALTLRGTTVALTFGILGGLAATAGTGRFDLRAASVAGDAAITSDAGVAIGRLAANTATIRAAATLAADTLAVAGALVLDGASIAVTDLSAGTLDAEAAADVDLRTAAVAGATRIGSGTTLTFGTLGAGSATLIAGTDLSGTTLTVGTTLDASAGRDLTIATTTAGGDSTLATTRTLALDSVTTPGALTLSGATVRATTIDAGSLGATAGTGGIDLTTATVARAARLTSGGDARIGSLTAGSIDVAAIGGVTADLLAATGGLNVVAASASVAKTRVTGGTTRFATGDGGLVLTALDASGDVEATTTGVLTAGRFGIDGSLTASGASASFADLRVGGDAGLAATAGALTVGRASVGGSATLAATGDLRVDRIVAGGALGVSAGGLASLVDAEAGGEVAVTARTIDLGTLSTPAAVVLTGGRIDVAALSGGSLVLRAGTDGADLRTATLAGAADLASDGGIAIGSLSAASGAFAVAGALSADTLTLRDRLDASAGNVRIGAVTVSAGPATIGSTAGDLRLDDAAVAGNATLTSAADLDVARIGVGGVLAVDAVGRASLVEARVGGDAGITAATIVVGSLSTPAGVTLTGRRIDATAIDGGSLVVRAGTDGADLRTTTLTGAADLGSQAGLTLGTLTAAGARIAAAGAFGADTLTLRDGLIVTAGGVGVGQATVSQGPATLRATGGDLRVGQAAIGSDATLAASGDVRVDRIVAGGTLGVTAGGLAALVDARAGGTTDVAGGTIAIGALRTPAAIALAGRRIDATTLEGGTLVLRAGSDGADLRTTTITGAADLASQGALALGTLTAASARIAATGSFVADSLALRDSLDVGARDVRVGGTVVAQGPAAIAATGGDLTLGSATIGGAATLTASGTIGIDALDVAGNLLGTATAVRIAQTTVRAGNARLAATGDAIRLGTAGIAGDAVLTAVGVVDAGTLTVGRTLNATGGSIAFRRASANGTTTLVARDAALALGEGRFAADASLTARGAITADVLATGTTLGASGDTIAFGNASVGRDATLAARDVTLGTFAADGAVTLGATGSAVIDALRVGERLVANAAALTARTTTVVGDATLTGGSVALTSASIGGNAAIDVTGQASADTLDVGGRLVANAATLTLGTATVRGGAATLTAGGVGIGQLTTSGATAITARGALAATRIDAGSGIVASAGSATVGQATARAGDVALTTTGGDLTLGAAGASGAVALTSSGAAAVTGTLSAGAAYRIDAVSVALGTTGATARQSGAEVTLVARGGAITGQGSTTLAATRAVTLTARGGNGGIAFAPETTLTSATADVTLATVGAASLGTVTASGGAIRLDASDATLTRALTAQAVTLTNVATAGVTRIGNAAIGNDTEFAAPATRFDLTNAEIGLVAAPTVTIASGARNVVVGAVGLGTATGSTRFAITATGRVDLLGRFVASGSTAARTIAIGNEASGTTPRTGVIRMAATQGEGGRLLVDGATLDLTAERIGGGLDRDFLDAIGYRTGSALGVDQVTRDYVARPTSTLYNAAALGAAPYSDGVLVQAGVLRLTYGSYALFQNTALLGQQAGAVLGIAGQAGANGATLRLQTPGSTSNTFALFGTIDGISSQAAALLGPERLAVGTGVSPVASRINGCVIGSGGGCLNTNLAQPALNLFDTSRAEIVRTADDLTLPFDPLIGTNNEALYLDTIADATAPECEGDKPCPTQP